MKKQKEQAEQPQKLSHDDEIKELRRSNDELHRKFMALHEHIMGKSEQPKEDKVRYLSEGSGPLEQEEEQSNAPIQTAPPPPEASQEKPPVNININNGPQPQAQPVAPPPPVAQAPVAPQAPQPKVMPPSQGLAQGLSPQGQAPTEALPPADGGEDSYQASDFNLPQNVGEELMAPSPMQSQKQLFDEHKTEHKTELEKQDEAYKQDLANGHITPKTYADLYAEKSTLGKVGTLFGLLVSGAGSGLAHQQNALLHMMDQQIQNDLQAQMKSKENAQNFLRINQADLANKVQALGGIENAKTAALARTQSQMYQTTYHNLLLMANRLPPAEQAKKKAALMTLYPELKNKINNLNDLAASAMAANNINPFKQQKPEVKPQGGGEAKKQSTEAGKKQAKKDYVSPIMEDVNTPILAPGAAEKLKSIAVSQRPDLAPFQSEISSQLSDAQRADRAIGEIKKLYSRMSENSESPTGYIESKAHNMAGVPVLGPMAEGLANSFSEVGPNAHKDRLFKADRAAMEAQIKAAFPNAGGDFINEIMQGNLPLEGDTPQNREIKLQNLVNKIKGKLATDKLDLAGMLTKKKGTK